MATMDLLLYYYYHCCCCCCCYYCYLRKYAKEDCHNFVSSDL